MGQKDECVIGCEVEGVGFRIKGDESIWNIYSDARGRREKGQKGGKEQRTSDVDDKACQAGALVERCRQLRSRLHLTHAVAKRIASWRRIDSYNLNDEINNDVSSQCPITRR